MAETLDVGSEELNLNSKAPLNLAATLAMSRRTVWIFLRNDGSSFPSTPYTAVSFNVRPVGHTAELGATYY